MSAAKETGRLTEKDMMPRQQLQQDPDFEIRHLDDYTYEDLDALLTSVLLAHSNVVLDAKVRDRLNIWSYRIGDAMKEVKKRKALGLHYQP